MKELQGAIIIGSAFQTLLGYTGLISLLVRYDSADFGFPGFSFAFKTCFVVSSNTIYSFGLKQYIM